MVRDFTVKKTIFAKHLYHEYAVINAEIERKMSMKPLLEKLKTKSRPILLGLAGIASASVIPVWQIYFVETSDVTLEITGIQRIESDHLKTTLDTDELQLLEPYIPEQLRYEYNPQGEKGDKIDYPEFTVSTLTDAYNAARQDLKNIAETRAKLEQYIATINAYLDPKDHEHQLSEFRVSEMKQWTLSNYIDDSEAHYYEQQVLTITRNYAELKFTGKQTPQFNLPALKFLLSDVRDDLGEVIKQNNHRLEQLRDNIRGIEAQLNKLKAEKYHQYSYFTLDVVAGNTGRVSTSLRPVALMRVQISDNNYVDVRLLMEDYQNNAELPPASTKVLHYRSAELNHLPNDDRTLVNTFWGSTGLARILTLDTGEHIYASNTIAFADNQNQKVMVDRLKKAAGYF